MSHIEIVTTPGGILRCREICPDGMPLRAPHHTVSLAGALQELVLAAGGLLYLDETPEFKLDTLRAIFRAWGLMHPKVRPVLVIDFHRVALPFAAPLPAMPPPILDELWRAAVAALNRNTYYGV